MTKLKNFIGIAIIVLLLPIKTAFYFVWNLAIIIAILIKLNFFEPELLTDKLKSILKQTKKMVIPDDCTIETIMIFKVN